MEATRSAYLSVARRSGGYGTCSPKDFCTDSGRPAILGVMKMPGAIVMTRMPKRASSRAIGKVIPNHATLRRRVPGLSDLSVESRDRCRIDDDAALAFCVGVVLLHGVRRFLDENEGAEQLGFQEAFEIGRRHRSVTPKRPSGQEYPRAARVSEPMKSTVR